ncbi:hypothetical protein [Nitrosomonas sp.]|uniref:hypothetical protein n=1 Tax=Nitrosomonas sp. TaxID=42353 RepID=UPI00260C9818|nr:hypothetical protein [Nitrosomonas sp.]MCW5601866.1 hypothetical protein [Nitrosomonas sp.]
MKITRVGIDLAIWQRAEEGGISLTQAQWEWLTMGVDWCRLSATICVKKYS